MVLVTDIVYTRFSKNISGCWWKCICILQHMCIIWRCTDVEFCDNFYLLSINVTCILQWLLYAVSCSHINAMVMCSCVSWSAFQILWLPTCISVPALTGPWNATLNLMNLCVFDSDVKLYCFLVLATNWTYLTKCPSLPLCYSWASCVMLCLHCLMVANAKRACL
jgi:hypothetical protein